VKTTAHPLCKKVLNDVTMDVGQAAGNSVVIEAEPFVIEAEQMQRRRVQIVAVAGILGRMPAEIVAGAVVGASVFGPELPNRCPWP
jgi:hypothetical protein